MRQFEAILVHEHELGERIFACGDAIAKQIGKLTAGHDPKLDQGKWISPPVTVISDDLRRAMAYFVHLIDHFANQVHLLAEEAMVSVAIGCGMAPKDGEWVINQHDQARAYWECLNIAWRRVTDGDDDDRWYALEDFRRTMEAFVFLFKAHAIREDFEFYPKAGSFIDENADLFVVNIIQHSGPSDITPYITMVGLMEQRLGIPSPPPPPAA